MCATPRLLSLIVTAAALVLPATARGDDEGPIFTPPGFDRPGIPAIAKGDDVARLEITVLDGARGGPRPAASTWSGQTVCFISPQ